MSGASSWSELLRPSSLSEVVGQSKSIVARLTYFSRNIHLCPNLLLHGPCGSGKTSAANALIQDCLRLFHESKYKGLAKAVTLTINGSCCTGIDVVRTDIQTFITNTALGSLGFPHHFVVIDECDMLKFHAQKALRRVMEEFQATVVFILVCNHESKIIDALKSRCCSFPFRALQHDAIVSAIQHAQETLMGRPGVLNQVKCELLATECQGDMRSAFNQLQMISSLAEPFVHYHELLEFLRVPDMDRIVQWLQKELVPMALSEIEQSSEQRRPTIYFFYELLSRQGEYLHAIVLGLFDHLLVSGQDYPWLVDWLAELDKVMENLELHLDFFVTSVGLVTGLWKVVSDHDKKKKASLTKKKHGSQK